MTTNTAVALIEEPDSRSAEIRDLDFQTIESAVMETIRGRWFLKEYARRNRHADTEEVLAAIERLTSRMAQPAADADLDRVRIDLKEMAEAISHTKHEIAAMNPDGEGESQILIASGELDSIVSETEQATSSILEAAEQVQEAAWIMREDGIDADMCDTLDGLATRIYTACSFQDLTGQRTSKVIGALKSLEDRIHAMSEIWDVEGWSKTDQAEEKSKAGQSPTEQDLRDQSDVDRVMDEAGEAAELQDTSKAVRLDALEEAVEARESGSQARQQRELEDLPAAELPGSGPQDAATSLDELEEAVLPGDLDELEEAVLPDDLDELEDAALPEEDVPSPDEIFLEDADEDADEDEGEDENGHASGPQMALDDDLEVHFVDPAPRPSEVETESETEAETEA
ncbi:MAG: hypothetical protein C0605_01105, partial [Hyphomicrobiales bacterium]